MQLLIFVIIGICVLAITLISAFYIFRELKAQELKKVYPASNPAPSAQDILNGYRHRGHYLSIIPPNVDPIFNRLVNVTIGNPTNHVFRDCQFQLVGDSNKEFLNRTSENNGTDIIIVFKTYDRVGPHFIDALELGGIQYHRGDKLVFGCKNPPESVEEQLRVLGQN